MSTAHATRRTIGIGLAGYGMIGRLHAMTYRQLPFLYPHAETVAELHHVCTAHPASAEAARREGSFTRASTDIREMLADPAVHLVDVALPNNLHRPVVEAALAAGKHVYCEKPLAGTLEDARAIYRAVRAAPAGVAFGMVFQYRFVPAIMRARQLLQDGALGQIYTYRAEYLHTGYQNPARPVSWRMQKEAGGSGALGDLGSHVIDLVRHLLGEFSSVQGHLETFVKERPVAAGASEMAAVTVDDVAWLRARMACGAVGTIEASRFATGTLDDLRLWIYGERGALHFSLMDPNYLYWFDEGRAGGELGGERGWQRLETVQYYPGAATPPPRSPMGWARTHAENQHAFLQAVSRGNEPSPSIIDGLRAQLVIDAVERSAQKNGSTAAVELE